MVRRVIVGVMDKVETTDIDRIFGNVVDTFPARYGL